MLKILVFLSVSLNLSLSEGSLSKEKSVSFRAVRLKYTKPKDIKSLAVQNCKKHFMEALSEQTWGSINHSVEILTVDPAFKKLTALCISRLKTPAQVVLK